MKLFSEEINNRIKTIYNNIKSGTQYEYLSNEISDIGAGMIIERNGISFLMKIKEASANLGDCKFLFEHEEIKARASKKILDVLNGGEDMENEGVFLNTFCLVFSFNAIFIKEFTKVNVSDN